jgi:hypothetical protein
MQLADMKLDLNAIGASRGALLHMKGSLRANHRFISDDGVRSPTLNIMGDGDN